MNTNNAYATITTFLSARIGLHVNETDEFALLLSQSVSDPHTRRDALSYATDYLTSLALLYNSLSFWIETHPDRESKKPPISNPLS